MSFVRLLFVKSTRKTHSRRLRPEPRKISQAQLQTMATEKASINSVKTKKQKTPVKKKLGKDCGR